MDAVSGSAKRRVFMSPHVADPKAPSSHAVICGNMVYTALTTPLRPDGSIARGDFSAQMTQCLDNIKTILTETGTSLDNVVKVTVVMPRITDFPEMNRIFREYFREGNYPARASIEAKMGNPDFLVEIECVAQL
jgi:2-iminobutanoate/2-iminopropanoate deaminase